MASGSERTLYPTVSDIVELNKALVEQSGEAFGVDNEAAGIEEIIEDVRGYENGTDRIDVLAGKAARLMFLIARNQEFNEANKRTAYVVTTEFLESNGLLLSGAFLEIYNFLQEVSLQTPVDFIRGVDLMRNWVSVADV